VSDLDHTTSSSIQEGRSRESDFGAMLGERTEREGLPRNYRMRADAHYVDQLDKPQSGPVVRLIAVRQIDAGEPPDEAALSGLTQSIAAHGMLQPLLVRRAGGRFHLIAGRKRLAAAVAGGASEVPCIVHEVSETAARALAEAESVRTTPEEPVETRSDYPAAVLAALPHDLARIGSLADVLELSGNLFQHRAAADFLKAEAWRASCLAGAAAILSTPARPGRIVTVSRVIDRMRTGFEPEVRLAKLHLELGATPDAADLQCDEQLAAVVSGLIFTTVAWLQQCESPRIVVRADAPSPLNLRVQIVQRQAPPPSRPRELDEAASSQDMTPGLALASARAFAAAHGGSLEVGGAGTRGTVIQLILERLSAS
jgi:hypothetical protein